MEYICVISVITIILVIISVVLAINSKKIKTIAEESKKLDILTEKYPNNVEICKTILKKLNNEKVKIEENKESKTSLYIAITDKITIANVKESFTRIQTIAHECLHSVQDRKILMFNFVYSNIYLLYFFIMIILGILKILPYKMAFLSIFILLGFIYYIIRAYLENDAMIKARYLAKEYMQEQAISTKEEIDKIVSGFDEINNLGIKSVNFSLAQGILIKTLIIAVIFAIF